DQGRVDPKPAPARLRREAEDESRKSDLAHRHRDGGGENDLRDLLGGDSPAVVVAEPHRARAERRKPDRMPEREADEGSERGAAKGDATGAAGVVDADPVEEREDGVASCGCGGRERETMMGDAVDGRENLGRADVPHGAPYEPHCGYERHQPESRKVLAN